MLSWLDLALSIVTIGSVAVIAAGTIFELVEHRGGDDHRHRALSLCFSIWR